MVMTTDLFNAGAVRVRRLLNGRIADAPELLLAPLSLDDMYIGRTGFVVSSEVVWQR